METLRNDLSRLFKYDHKKLCGSSEKILKRGRKRFRNPNLGLGKVERFDPHDASYVVLKSNEIFRYLGNGQWTCFPIVRTGDSTRKISGV